MSEPAVNLRDWIGREEVREDVITIAPLSAMSATLDRDDPVPRVGDGLPPLWHWLYFLPRTRTSQLGADGHTMLGGFLPPVGLPRRMWAGSRLAFEHLPRVGDAVQRVSRIVDVQEKHGASGRLVFVTLQHEVHSPRGVAIREAQDIVYRNVPNTGNGSAPASADANVPVKATSPATIAAKPDASGSRFSRVITPDPVLLFRYSALTFNSHRIHYDRRHVTEVEGYPGLLVHGPLIATLLLDLLRRELPNTFVREFTFKVQRPLFDSEPFSIHGRAEDANRFSLWAVDRQGLIAAQASAVIA